MADAVPYRGPVRRRGSTRVAHGLGWPPAPELEGRDLFLRTLSAWRLVLPPDAVFTHVTAALLLGWWLPKLPEPVPVFAATRAPRRPRRPGLVCSRLTHPSDAGEVDGLPVDHPAEILLRLAREFGPLDLAVTITSALRTRAVTREELDAICTTGRPGVAVLRTALSHCDPRAESGPEVMLRIFLRLAGIDSEPQAVITDEAGRFVARVDLLVKGTTVVVEYDGADHRLRSHQQLDLRRERRLAETPYVRRGFTLDDLLNHPGVMLHELDRAIGRPHHPRRLARWRSWVADSVYSEAGRRRLVNRWARQMGGSAGRRVA